MPAEFDRSNTMILLLTDSKETIMSTNVIVACRRVSMYTKLQNSPTRGLHDAFSAFIIWEVKRGYCNEQFIQIPLSHQSTGLAVK